MNNVIIFPTDTVYGIGTGFLSKDGIRRIYEIKGRDFNKPLAILCSNINDLKDYAYINDKAIKLANNFWPGGLTLVLKSKPNYEALSGEKTIGVRMPNHKLALELLRKHGPLKTTSVNQSGEVPMNDYQLIYDRYHTLVDHIYENHEPLSEVSSTVVDLTLDEVKIIRLGYITLEAIKSVLGS